jgi:hypothetical protein
MRLSTPLFALALLGGTVSAAALTPAVAPRVSKSRPAKATPVVAHHAKAASTVATATVKHTRRATAAKPIAAPAPAPAQAGMIIAVDPETGQFSMPSAEQLEALGVSRDPALDDSDEGLIQVHHPNGMVSVDLQGRFQEYSVLRIAPDGTRVMACVPTRAQAAHVLTIPPSTPALEVK